MAYTTQKLPCPYFKRTHKPSGQQLLALHQGRYNQLQLANALQRHSSCLLFLEICVYVVCFKSSLLSNAAIRTHFLLKTQSELQTPNELTRGRSNLSPCSAGLKGHVIIAALILSHRAVSAKNYAFHFTEAVNKKYRQISFLTQAVFSLLQSEMRRGTKLPMII